jgi:hypothetical protein
MAEKKGGKPDRVYGGQTPINKVPSKNPGEERGLTPTPKVPPPTNKKEK